MPFAVDTFILFSFNFVFNDNFKRFVLELRYTQSSPFAIPRLDIKKTHKYFGTSILLSNIFRKGLLICMQKSPNFYNHINECSSIPVHLFLIKKYNFIFNLINKN